MNNTAKSADLVLLTFNKYQYTEYCLSALLQTSYRPFRVIIIDNGSTDRTPELIKRFKEMAAEKDITVETVINNENLGAIKGRNQALALIESEYVIFMDNDIVVSESSWADTLIGFLEDHSDAGAVSPKLIYPWEPFLIQCAGCDVSPAGKVNFRGRGFPGDTPAFNSKKTVQALITACMAVPGHIIRSTGLFDEQFSPVQFEDIDYCYRIKEQGFSLYFTPETEMYHFENVTTSRTASLNPAYNTVKNGLKFKKKWDHQFSQENGPNEKEMDWKEIPMISIESINPAILPDKLLNPDNL